MKILFAASEFSQLIKVGGLADVVGSLAKEIKQAGHDIRVILPFYQSLKEKKLDPLNPRQVSPKFGRVKKIAQTNVTIGKNNEEVAVYQTTFVQKSLSGKSASLPIYLIENNTYISNGDIYLDAGEFSSVARFLFFSQTVGEWIKIHDWRPDIIHVHDWQTGLIPLFIKIKQLSIKTVFTIHNLLIQGQWNYETVLAFLGLRGDEAPSLSKKVSGIYGDDFNIVQQAILNADIITTVSPQYSKEITTDESCARGLYAEIAQRANDIYGIVNSIDISLFNPKTDPHINTNYSIKTLDKKTDNKLYLQKITGLNQDKNTPVFGMVTRLDIQKGIDFIASLVNEIVKTGCQIVFLGTGQKKYEDMLIHCSQKYPKNVATYIRFDEKLAQQIYAGADIFLMPSRFEPCGLSQMISMRYGTIPLVRATGGLVDTVKNVKIRQGLLILRKGVQGTGFSFRVFDKKEFIATLKRVLHIYSQKKLWRQIQINAMRTDFSWKRSAKKYIELYRRIIV